METKPSGNRKQRAPGHAFALLAPDCDPPHCFLAEAPSPADLSEFAQAPESTGCPPTAAGNPRSSRQNGLLVICELKSSIDKAGMYSFERKARSYEQQQRTANRLGDSFPGPPLWL